MQGWIKLHRKIQDHWLYREKRKFSKYEAWLDLLMMVNHENKKAVLGNEIFEVKRGQRITSIRKLCDKWGWSNTKVTKFLNLLQEDGMINLKSDSKKSIITIVNYDCYQSGEDEKTTPKKHIPDTMKTKRSPNKNDKELKNDKEIKKLSCSKSQIYEEQSATYKLSLRLFNKIRKNIPEFKEPNLKKWSDDFRLMMEKDNRAESQIEFLIDWCQQDSFWKSNILSPSKLRKQFDQLVLKAQIDKRKDTHNFSESRPHHWREPRPLTKDEYLEMKEAEADLF